MTGDFEGQASDFWGFATALYARPGVAALCLDLQDRAGHDVNLLLLSLWAGEALGLALDDWDLADLAAAVAPWNLRAVHPLRILRRSLKGEPWADTLRARIGTAELEAERLAQRHLLATLPLRSRGVPSPELGFANLERYAGSAAALSLSALFEAGAAPRPSA
ncbi:MAG TPA: TIGR02444 family protein [Aliidongia sp.]|uniref:TIGR02444 family protein n=1 Tax=Aliidongia sp. TaxID=1914230 RepID=UPI002DDD1D4E|nr:TIGR02444 family protein [Aliidongia sp.]HEV2673854.1 TIGR02444 family protein [Aliidongia sp.]